MARIIVAGSRGYTDRVLVWTVLEQWFSDGDVMINGMCPEGPDHFARDWLLGVDMEIRLKERPANWKVYGKAAGPIRNRWMAEQGDILLAFWDGASRGTWSMIQEALTHGLDTHVYVEKKPEEPDVA